MHALHWLRWHFDAYRHSKALRCLFYATHGEQNDEVDDDELDNFHVKLLGDFHMFTHRYDNSIGIDEVQATP